MALKIAVVQPIQLQMGLTVRSQNQSKDLSENLSRTMFFANPEKGKTNVQAMNSLNSLQRSNAATSASQSVRVLFG